MTWVIAIAGFMFADRLARGGPLPRREGRRHARRALLALLPAAGRELSRAARPSTRSALLPLGGYVKITGMTPGGARERRPARVRPRLLHEGAVEADLRDPRRTRGQPAAGARAVHRGPAVGEPRREHRDREPRAVPADAQRGGADDRERDRRRTAAPPACCARATASPRSTAGRVAGSTVAGAITALHLRCAGPTTKGCAATTHRRRHRRPRRAHADDRRAAALRPGAQAHAAGHRPRPHRARSLRPRSARIGTSAAALWDVGALDRHLLRQGVHELEGAQAAPERRRDHPGHPAGGLARARLRARRCWRSSRSCSRSSTCSRSCRSTAGTSLWSLAEKIRGKRVSFGAMWRYSSVGVVLLAFLVLNGIGNDISRLSG